MKRSLVQASFFFGKGKAHPSLRTFREAYTLAKSYGSQTSAVVVHYAIAACLPEARYPIKAYPCTFQQAYSGYPERAQEVRIDEIEAEKRAIAERAIVERATIERIHAEEFPDYTTMNLAERVQAAKRFQQRVRQVLGPATRGPGHEGSAC